MLVLPNSAVKRAEAEADARSLSYEAMMENAGRALAAVIEAHSGNGGCVIICGRGRNAGDGYVAARILSEHGIYTVVAELYSDGYDSLTLTERERVPEKVRFVAVCDNFDEYSELLEKADVICDAVFGTGFRGQLTGLCARAVEAANEVKAYKVSADVPSGLSDENELFFRADETVAMLCFKDIHALKPTASLCGRVSTANIGIEDKYIKELPGAYELITSQDAARLLPVRAENAHKGTFGHALIVAGSYCMPGAAVLACNAALRSGAGLVTCAFPEKAYAAVAPQIPESILMPLPCDENGAFSAECAPRLAAEGNKYSSVCIGCGITKGEGARSVTEALIENYEGTLIIDADAINIVAENKEMLRKKAGRLVLTPHPGEMSRLTGMSIPDIENNLFAVTREFAREYGVTLLLKGHNTLIASPEGKTRLVTSGTNALSRGGAGDMLTGIIVSLASYIDNVSDAVSLAAYIHGRAGALAGEELNSRSCAVGDIAKKYIGRAFGEL